MPVGGYGSSMELLSPVAKAAPPHPFKQSIELPALLAAASCCSNFTTNPLANNSRPLSEQQTQAKPSGSV